MPRYIDADRFNDFDYEKFDGRLTDDTIEAMETVLREIDKSPTADVQEVKHGKWIFYSDMCDKKCDTCGKFSREVTDYCPHCGARMDGDE